MEKKLDDEIENIFLHDTGGNLSNLSSNISNTNETTVIAENGIIKANKLFLFNGQIISSKSSTENELISFDNLISIYKI